MQTLRHRNACREPAQPLKYAREGCPLPNAPAAPGIPGAGGILARVSEDKSGKRRGPTRPPNPKQLARALRGREKPEAPPTEAGPTGPVIRRASSKDLAAVLALRALMFSAMGTGEEQVAAAQWQANALRWLQVKQGNPEVFVAVADVNGSTVATAMGEVVDRPPSPGNPTGRVGMLGNVATFPQYRMTGLGQGCVDAVMDWFRDETDVTSVELFATPEGRRRYEVHGFATHEFPHLRVDIDRTPPPDPQP